MLGSIQKYFTRFDTLVCKCFFRIRTQTHSHAKQVNRSPTDAKAREPLKPSPVQRPGTKSSSLLEKKLSLFLF